MHFTVKKFYIHHGKRKKSNKQIIRNRESNLLLSE